MNMKLSAGVVARCTAALILLSLSYSASADKDIMVVLDNSGSMRKNDPAFLARGAVASFIEQLGPGTSAGMLIFDQGVTVPVPLTPIDDASKTRLIDSLDNINYRGQLTDSPAAIERAIYELKTKGRADANKLIVFMTDGIVDTGNPEADIEKTKWLRDELAVDAKANGIRVFAIAFTENADFFLIQSLANKTDGEYYRAMEPSALAGVFDTVYGELDTPPEVVAATPPPPAAPPVEIAAPEPDLSAEALAEAEPVPESGAAVTPLPDSRLAPEPLPATASAELLASLSEDERLALEDISAQTGIPIEQLATELVGADTEVDAPGRVESGGAIVMQPDAGPTAEDERRGMMILVGAALILLVLVILVVWFLRRRAKGDGAGAAPASSTAAAAEQAMPEAFLNDINHYTDDPAIQLGEKPLMVGRVAGTDTQHLDYLVVNKGTVGRRHAIIKYKDYSFWIVDQGSVNGTFVNSERLSGERQLKHGDRIGFHKYEFEFSQPEMDDGFHTVFAEPNAADATIVASAGSLAATQALDAATAIRHASAAEDHDDSDALFGVEQAAADAAVDAEAPAAAFADSDVFDITGETAITNADEAAITADPNDETLEEGSTAVFAAAPEMTPPEADDFDSPSTVIMKPDQHQAPMESHDAGEEDEEYDEDDEDLGVEINLDTIGADDHPSLILDSPPLQSPPQEDFDADASAFFEDITVGPTPDDEAGPTPDADGDGMFDMDTGGDDQAALDAKLERASALLDGDSDDDGDFGELETMARSDLSGAGKSAEESNDVTLDKFIETDSFDAPETVPPVHPKTVAGDDAGDVTLDAFMSTSMFESGKVELTNEDETVVPDAVPDNPGDDDNPIAGDTVVLPSSPLAHKNAEDDDDDDDDSEDPTILR